jgi:hypothetical protein
MVELIKAGQAIKLFKNGVDQALIPKRETWLQLKLR